MRKPADSYIFYLFRLLRQKRERSSTVGGIGVYDDLDTRQLNHHDESHHGIHQQSTSYNNIPPPAGYRMSALKFAEGYVKPRYVGKIIRRGERTIWHSPINAQCARRIETRNVVLSVSLSHSRAYKCHGQCIEG